MSVRGREVEIFMLYLEDRSCRTSKWGAMEDEKQNESTMTLVSKLSYQVDALLIWGPVGGE